MFYDNKIIRFINKNKGMLVIVVAIIIFLLLIIQVLNKASLENVKDNINQNIYKSIIPRNIRLAEAPSYGMPINLYDDKSAGAEHYRMLANEVINK